MPQLNPYREILNEFVDEEFKPLLKAKMKSKEVKFSDMVLSDSEFKTRLPQMSADDVMALPQNLRQKALEIDREGVLRKFQ
jgi:hypothetical protein